MRFLAEATAATSEQQAPFHGICKFITSAEHLPAERLSLLVRVVGRRREGSRSTEQPLLSISLSISEDHGYSRGVERKGRGEKSHRFLEAGPSE